MPPLRAPSPELLVLGRGILRLAPIVDGNRLPWRDLGNVENFTVSTADTKLTKNSSRSGLATVYKEVTSEREVTLSLTGNEFDLDNLAAILQGEVETVAAVTGSTVVDESIALNGRGYGLIQTAQRLISALTVEQAKATAAAAVADGGNVGTATITAVTTNIGSVTETITITATMTGGNGVGTASVTGSVSGALGTATVGTPFTSAPINFTITDAGMTDLTSGDEYTIALTGDVILHTVTTDYILTDAARGLITIVEGGGIDPDFPVLVSYTYASRDASRKVKGATLSTQECSIMFAADNAVGPNQDALFFRVSLTPDGELGFISEDWGTWSLSGKLLDDSAGAYGGSVDSPLYELTEKPVAAA
jgi:hypothetical protein